MKTVNQTTEVEKYALQYLRAVIKFYFNRDKASHDKLVNYQLVKEAMNYHLEGEFGKALINAFRQIGAAEFVGECLNVGRDFDKPEVDIDDIYYTTIELLEWLEQEANN